MDQLLEQRVYRVFLNYIGHGPTTRAHCLGTGAINTNNALLGNQSYEPITE